MTARTQAPDTNGIFDSLVAASTLKARLYRVGAAIGLQPDSIDDRRNILMCAVYARAVERLLRSTLISRGVLTRTD